MTFPLSQPQPPPPSSQTSLYALPRPHLTARHGQAQNADPGGVSRAGTELPKTPAGQRGTWNPSQGRRRQTRWPSPALSHGAHVICRGDPRIRAPALPPQRGSTGQAGGPQSGETFPRAPGPGGLAERTGWVRARSGRQKGQLQELSGPLRAETRLLLTSPQSPGQSWARRPGRARGTCNPPPGEGVPGGWLRGFTSPWVNARCRQPGLS